MTKFVENIIIRSEAQSAGSPLQTDFSAVEIGKEYQLKATIKPAQKIDVVNSDQNNVTVRTDLIFSIVSVEKLRENEPE